MNKFLRFAFLLTAILTVSAVGAAAQNMSGTVKTSTVKFAPGKSNATVRGTASYAMSYVYKFTVKQGQTISVNVDSKEPALTFSVFPPKSETELDFNTKEWMGIATQSGAYSITLVMNNEKAKRVPYSLTIQVK